MATLQELKDELKNTVDKANGIRTKWSGANIPESDIGELGQLQERGLKLHKAIEEETLRAQNADFAKLSRFLDDPNYKVPRSVNADVDGKKSLQNIGWEFKGGKVFIPTSTGKTVEMYDEDVLFSPLVPTDDEQAAKYFRQSRAIIQPIYRTSFTKFMRLCAKNRSESMAFHALNDEEKKALSEGVDEAGGYLVPPDLQAEILVRLAQQSVMRRLARTVTTSRDRIVWPRVAPHGDPTLESIYSSGFVGGWVGETPAFVESDPTFGTFEVSIRKIRVATKVSNDFIADAVTDIPAWLAMNGAENLRLVEDAGFINGNGGPLQPQGILNDPGLKTVDVEGSTANTISNTAAANGSANKLINLSYALPSQYAANAEWLMKRATEGKVRQLVDGAGRYLWPAMTDSGFTGRLPPLMGSTANNSEFVPGDGADGNKVLIYGDFSQYIIAQRSQLSVVVLRERFADTDQTGIIIFERVGGALWNNDAIRVGVV